MALFDSIKIYAGNWAVVSEKPLTSEEMGLITKAEVVSSKFGTSVCFFMKAGGLAYFPMSSDSTVGVGGEVNLANIQVIELAKPGEENITRIKI